MFFLKNRIRRRIGLALAGIMLALCCAAAPAGSRCIYPADVPEGG